MKKLRRYAKGSFVVPVLGPCGSKKRFGLRIQVPFISTMTVYANICKCFYDDPLYFDSKALCVRFRLPNSIMNIVNLLSIPKSSSKKLFVRNCYDLVVLSIVCFLFLANIGYVHD